MIGGIITGNKGVMVLLHPDGSFARRIAVPSKTMETHNGPRVRMDVPALVNTMSTLSLHRVVVEAAGGSVTTISGAYACGFGAGVLEGILSALYVSRAVVAPAVWQAAYGIPSRDEGRAEFIYGLAERHWPGQLRDTGHEGHKARRAALMALYSIEAAATTKAAA